MVILSIMSRRFFLAAFLPAENHKSFNFCHSILIFKESIISFLQVVLAAEAGMSYTSVAMVTDFDCWHESEEAVTVEKVMAVVKMNADNVKRLFVQTVKKMGEIPFAEWEPLIVGNRVSCPDTLLFNCRDFLIHPVPFLKEDDVIYLVFLIKYS